MMEAVWEIEWEEMGEALHSQDCGRRSIHWFQNPRIFLRLEASPSAAPDTRHAHAHENEFRYEELRL